MNCLFVALSTNTDIWSSKTAPSSLEDAVNMLELFLSEDKMACRSGTEVSVNTCTISSLFGREAHKTLFNMTPLSKLPLITIGIYKICMHVLFDPLVRHRIQGSSFTWENYFDYLKRYYKMIPHSATHISILTMPLQLQLHFLYVFTRPPPHFPVFFCRRPFVAHSFKCAEMVWQNKDILEIVFLFLKIK